MLIWKKKKKCENSEPKNEPVIFWNKCDKGNYVAHKYIRELKELEKNIGNIPKQKELARDIGKLEKGCMGEDEIEYYLETCSFQFPVYCLRDVFLQTEDIAAQIDFILITPKYIYSIESKNWKDKIKATSEGWFRITKETQVPIDDPIVQNRIHLEVIRRVLEKVMKKPADFHYQSLVVNANKHENKWDCSEMDESKKRQVVYLKELPERIKENEENSSVEAFEHDTLKEVADLILLRQDQKKYYTREMEKVRQKYFEKTSEDEAIEELTMLLLYLSSKKNVSHKGDRMWSWKNYCYDILNRLDEGDYIDQTVYTEKKVYLTGKGVERAKRLMGKYGIGD